MNSPEILIPLLVPIASFVMVFGLVYLKRKENMVMIEKGMNPREFANRPAPYRNLKNGLLLIGAGVGLTIAYIFTQYILHDYNNPALWFALTGIGGGLGLIGSYRIEKKELLDKQMD
jgi:hypothetical protein